MLQRKHTKARDEKKKNEKKGALVGGVLKSLRSHASPRASHGVYVCFFCFYFPSEGRERKTRKLPPGEMVSETAHSEKYPLRFTT